MPLEQTINAEIKTAMLAKDEITLRTVRAIKAAILLAKTSEGAGGELKEADEIKMLQKLVKQRKDALSIYQQQNRSDLAKIEQDEIEVIERFLPKQLGPEELKERLAKIEKLLALNNNPLASGNLSSSFLAKPVPNPAQGIATIAYGVAPEASAIRLAIINIKGQVVKEIVLPNTTSGQVKVNMQALRSGTYNCTLLVEGQITATQKLVVQK